MKHSSRFALLDTVELVWSHGGTLHRATLWPEIAFERQAGRAWIGETPDEEACAAAAASIDDAAWRRYLALIPGSKREFLENFRFGRIEALVVLARCPGLFADLSETPALASFVAAHANLRGTVGSGWDEINAVHERSGIFGLLDWLGLPSSRQTLAILRNLADADLPKRLLAPLRSALWEPEVIHALEHAPVLTDQDLEHHCRAIAA